MKTLKALVLTAILAAVAMLAITAIAASNKKETIVLSKDNVVVLNDVVTGESTAKVLEQAKKLDKDDSYLGKAGLRKNNKPIYLFLFTPGGSIQAGLELMEGLYGLERPVHTISSFSASMGFQLVQGLGDRYILQSGVLMSHSAYGGSEGEFNGTGNSQLRNRLGIWEQRMREMDETTVKRTKGKQTMESYLKAYDNELWVTGTQAVEQGYADKKVTVRCDKSLDGYTTHQIMFMGIIPIQYDLSNCPLNTTPVNIRVAIDTNKGRIWLSEFKAKSGGFGVTCFQYAVLDKEKVCALDTTLNDEKVVKAASRFLDRYINIRNYVIPLQAK